MRMIMQRCANLNRPGEGWRLRKFHFALLIAGFAILLTRLRRMP